MFSKVSPLPDSSGQQIEPCGRSLETELQVVRSLWDYLLDGHLTVLSPGSMVIKPFDCTSLLVKKSLASALNTGIFIYKSYYY